MINKEMEIIKALHEESHEYNIALKVLGRSCRVSTSLALKVTDMGLLDIFPSKH